VSRVPEKYLKLLERLRLNRVSHSGRDLRQHLVGTWQLLNQWHMPQPVCVAGLCHSLYGTNVFRVSVLHRPSDRRRLASIIGPRAEHLVYLFSLIDRPRALLSVDKRADKVGIKVSGARSVVAVSKRTYISLLAIELANLIEQGSQWPFLEKLYRLLARRHVSIRSKHAIQAALLQHRRRPPSRQSLRAGQS
jgi:hypothetical protein